MILDNLKSPGNFIFTKENKPEPETYDVKMNLESTLLTKMFFSSKNVHNIQNIIRYRIHSNTNLTIDNQNTQDILIIMRSIYYEHAKHPPNPNQSNPEPTVLKLYTEETARLNNLVIEEIYSRVYSGLTQYLGYLRDASTVPYLDNKPVTDTTKGLKSLKY